MEREVVWEAKVKGTLVTSERSLSVMSRSLKLVASTERALVEGESSPPLKVFPTTSTPVRLPDPVILMPLPAWGRRRLSDFTTRPEEVEEPPILMSWASLLPAPGGVSAYGMMTLPVPVPSRVTFVPESVRVSFT